MKGHHFESRSPTTPPPFPAPPLYRSLVLKSPAPPLRFGMFHYLPYYIFPFVSADFNFWIQIPNDFHSMHNLFDIAYLEYNLQNKVLDISDHLEMWIGHN